MNWMSFHHPDLSLPVIRRRAAEEWLDLLCGVGEILASQGRSVPWNNTYPNQTAYYNAMSRLRKKGLVAQHDSTGGLPFLVLTDAAKQQRAAYHRPDKLWNTRWNGIWYMLIFDVPESERHYRDTLRKFLKQLRMGWLQKSVWITPRDIRPEYDDLEKSACVNAVAYLFESRTVLHRDQQELVYNTWDFERLHVLQRRYLEIFTQNLDLIPRAQGEDELLKLLYQESEAYIHSMRFDPLLPKELHPENYLGLDVWKLHNTLIKAVGRVL